LSVTATEPAHGRRLPYDDHAAAEEWAALPRLY
jgi:hypothetical protein